MSNHPLINEKVLLDQLAIDNPSAFAELYNHYNRAVYFYVIKYVNSAALAEDLTQEIFIKIWESRKRMVGIRSFKAYLFITARNHTFNNLKIAAKTETLINKILSNYVLQASTEENILDKEYVQFLKKTLDSLPDRTREIFRLCRDESKTYKEVASTMNISCNAVKNHMVYSMKVFSSSMEKELGISLAS